MRSENIDLFLRRKDLKVTQTEVAGRLGCGVSSVSKFENGQAPLPHGKTREDYERALSELVRERLMGAPA